jgi:hypothetical protein
LPDLLTGVFDALIQLMKSNPLLLAAFLAVNSAIAWDEDPVATAVNGNTFFSDGESATTVGKNTFFSDGTVATRVGKNTFYSDGGSSTTIGKNTFYDDGTVATRIGNNTFIDSDDDCGAKRALKAVAVPSLSDEVKIEADDELVLPQIPKIGIWDEEE